MSYTKDDIEKLALSQLSAVELVRAFKAFKEFSDDFGRAWLEKFMPGVMGRGKVLAVINIWEDWSLIKNLPGWEKLETRWRIHGIDGDGVRSEIRVVAVLLRKGARVKLFPRVASREADFCFGVSDLSVYSEVSRRELSEIKIRIMKMLKRVADAATEAVPGRHGKVAVFRELTEEEENKLLGWLRLPRAQGRHEFEDIAALDLDTLESGADDQTSLFGDTDTPILTTTTLRLSQGGCEEKGSASAQISDTAAEEFLEREAEQLPKNGPGIIWLDVSQITRGLDHWPPLIQRRFQPTLNRRISAVVLLSTVIASGGLETVWKLLSNPYARTSIPRQEEEIIRRLCTT